MSEVATTPTDPSPAVTPRRLIALLILAAGLMASHLAGFPETPAVAVGMGAAAASALGLPLSAVVLATVLTTNSGAGAGPLVIVGVVVAFVTTRALDRLRGPERPPGEAATSEQRRHAPAVAPAASTHV